MLSLQKNDNFVVEFVFHFLKRFFHNVLYLTEFYNILIYAIIEENKNAAQKNFNDQLNRVSCRIDVNFFCFCICSLKHLMQNNMPPDMPNDAMQYNRSDMTPTGKIEQVKAMNVSVFIYKNVTMMMNITQNCEMNVTIDPQVTNKVVAINVDPNQTMTLAMNCTAQPPNGEAVMERTLNFLHGAWNLMQNFNFRLSCGCLLTKLN